MTSSPQIAALKYMLFQAKQVSDIAKQLLWFLIDKSDNLTKDVCLTLVANREGFSSDEIQELAYAVDRMLSCNSTTHCNELLQLAGSEFLVSVHYGDFDKSRTEDAFNCDGIFENAHRDTVSRPGLIRNGMPMRYTFWLAKERYSRQAALVLTSREELSQIDIKRPGLYPYVEPYH